MLSIFWCWQRAINLDAPLQAGVICQIDDHNNYLWENDPFSDG